MRLEAIPRLDRCISAAALSLSIAVLPCLILIFVGCSSPSTSRELYFLKVDLTDFPKADHLFSRGPIGIDSVGASAIVPDGANAVNNVPSTARESADRISSETTSAIQNTIQSEADKLKSHIAQYYSVGLWSYCKYGHVSETTCSDPSLNFAFNLSSALGSALVKIDEVLRPIDEATISGYRQMSHAIIYLYISGLVAITLAAALGIQKTLFDRGNRLLSILSPLSALLITAATVGATVMYGLVVVEVKSKLRELGVKAVLGSRLFGVAWLAVFLSIGSSITWLIQLFCCCI